MKYINSVLLFFLIVAFIFFGVTNPRVIKVEKEVLQPFPIGIPQLIPYRAPLNYQYVEPISKWKAIEILVDMKNTHDYYVFIEPRAVEFHEECSYRYQQIIDYLLSIKEVNHANLES